MTDLLDCKKPFKFRWSLESGDCVRIFFNYSNKTHIDNICFSNSGKIMAVGCKKL